MNPYRRADRIRRRNFWRAHPGRSLWIFLGPLLLGLLAAPLSQPVLLWFCELEDRAFAAGLAGLGLRLGLLLCGVGILAVHSQVVRGQDRRVLDPHPADPAQLAAVLGLGLARRSAGMALGCCLLLAPLVVQGRQRAFLMACALILGGWACGISLGFLAQLGGVWAARSPALATLLEALRGGNPRMQAALIYAPGFAVAICSAALYLASVGLEQALQGSPVWTLALAAPSLLAAMAWLLVAPLAERTWYRATTLLAEVDAAYAGLEDDEEARRVYLEWATRWAPARLQPHLLRSLRQGWRACRGWVTGAWGLGLLGAIAGWSDASDATPRVVVVAGGALLCLAALAIVMERGDPPWLGRSIGLAPGPRLLARGLAVLAYLQGALLPGVLSVLLRRGGEALLLLAELELLALGATTLATLASPLGRRAWAAYVPLALGAWILASRSVT